MTARQTEPGLVIATEAAVRAAWDSGRPLWAIAAAIGVSHGQVMDVVRALGLPDRHPTTRQVLTDQLPPLDRELTAI